MNVSDLREAGRAPVAPARLALEGELLLVERWLRILPGQRYVGRAQWNGRTVLAKLYVGPRAQRHAERERGGVSLLHQAGVQTPALLHHGRSGEAAWLLFEFRDAAEGLGTAWARVEQAPAVAPGQAAVLRLALQAIGDMHGRGVWQADLHLDNFLKDAEALWVIDGAAVAGTPGQPLEAGRVLDNLALFFAQLPGRFDAHLPTLITDYPGTRPDLDALRAAIVRARQARLAHFLQKIGRDCTAFRVRRGAFGLEAVVRGEADRLAALLADPDAAIAGGELLKDGGSATVARVQAGDRQVVIKRYNIKGIGHLLKRFWRPTRAWHSWREGHRLNFLGIASPPPLAVIERRWLGLRGRGYLITDYAPGEDIIARLSPYLDGKVPQPELQALEQLFADLVREGVVHGDLKGTNLLWQAPHWSLIDLDALQVCAGEALRRGHRRDRARLLRNWPADSGLHRLLEQRLPRLDD